MKKVTFHIIEKMIGYFSKWFGTTGQPSGKKQRSLALDQNKFQMDQR